MRPIACRFWRAWEWALDGFSLLLCVRFLIATVHETPASITPIMTLALGSVALGCCRPGPALFAFAAAVPLLNGIARTSLLPGSSPSSLVFAGIFLGWCLRRFTVFSLWQIKRSLSPHHKQSLNGHGNQASTANEYKSAPKPEPSEAKTLSRIAQVPSAVTIVVNLLLSAVLVSLIYQIVRNPDQPALWNAFWYRPIFGFGDPLYFLTSAFIWAQGLCFFRLAHACRVGVTAWLRPVFFSYVACLLFFAALQWKWQFPDAYESFALTAPYEDIHSFGAIAISCFIFFLAAWCRRPIPVLNATASLLGLAGLLALVIGSWSRATWLAGLAGAALIGFLRITWKWRAAIFVAGIGLLVAANQAAKTPTWQNNLYLSRFGSLVRFENPQAKDPSRINLYHKALGMIREHPLFGHGIGVFYAKSVQYARAGDPYADIPNFAHDFALQFAVELGIPLTLLLLALIGSALWRGYRAQGETAKWARPLALALTCYLITQLTANALNIYVSNQFFFWTMMAALLCGDLGVESLKGRRQGA